jgi:hypothetical protein
MIINEELTVKWNNSNKKHLINVGYIFTKINDDIEIKVKDLPCNSHYKILCQCDICNKIKNLKYQYYIRFTNNLSEKYFCNTCNKIKTKETNIKKYGVGYPQQNVKIREKIKETNIVKYGFENSFQSELIKNKIKRNKYY